MQLHARFICAILIACASAHSFALEAPLQAPNVVVISPKLVTAGQPTAAALAGLGAQGFKAVIYLAPLTVADAVPAEAGIVRGQGIEFIHIPIEFGDPTEADYLTFAAAMNRLRDQKVLVHCQVDMRASSMTFLYRVLVNKENPELAYEAVSRVWSPRGVWKTLITTQLRKANIPFEPF
ncbi:MAG: protein tyrosine phosphatase family protein [Pseudomonadota bacterium]